MLMIAIRHRISAGRYPCIQRHILVLSVLRIQTSYEDYDIEEDFLLSMLKESSIRSFFDKQSGLLSQGREVFEQERF